MTLCDHVINRLCGFEDNRLALEPTTLSSLVAICLAKLKHNVFCQLCDDLIICSKHQKTWFMVTHTIYLYLFKFSSHRPRGSEDISFLIWQVTSYGHADLLNLLKKTLMENFIFCAVSRDNELLTPSGFYFTDTDNSRDNRGRGRTIFILLFHFQPLANIQKIICNYACEMTITYFCWHRLYLPDCNSMRFITISDYHLTMLDFDCLLNDLILAFCYSNLRRETGGLELAPTITIVS